MFAVVSGLFVATQVRETKGQELEDMTGATGRTPGKDAVTVG